MMCDQGARFYQSMSTRRANAKFPFGRHRAHSFKGRGEAQKERLARGK